MNSMASTFRIVIICVACMAVGAMLVDPIESIMKHSFTQYYQQNSIMVWLSVAMNIVLPVILLRRARQVLRDRKKNINQEEKAGVAPSIHGVGFITTPFIRISIYIAFYVLGLGLIFILNE